MFGDSALALHPVRPYRVLERDEPMITTRNVSVLLGGTVTILLLAGCGGETKQLQAENEALRAEVAAL